MDAGYVKGPVAAVAIAPQRTTEKAEAVTRTELPAEQAVPQTGRTEQAQSLARNAESALPREAENKPDKQLRTRETKTKIDLDPETSSVVFKSIDAESGDIVQQFPAEAILKLRAYARESTEVKPAESVASGAQDVEHVDKEA